MTAPQTARWIGVVGAIVVTAGGTWAARMLYAAQNSSAPSQRQASPPAQGGNALPRSVEVVSPQRTTMSRSLAVPATFEPLEKADLYAKASGYVAEVRVDIGDRVKAGDLLVVIDVPEMAGELAESQAQHVARVAAAAAAEARIVQARKLLDVSQSQLRRAQEDLSLRQINLRRREELFAGKVIPTEQLDEARSQHAVATADIGIAEARVAAAEADIRSAEADRAAATAEADVAAAHVEKVRTLIQYARIIAPFDGVITRRLVDRGAFVQSAASTSRPMSMLTLQRIDMLRIFIDVPEPDVPYVRPGVKVRIKPYGQGAAPLDAAVTRIASSLNPGTRTMRTEIDLPNKDRQLLPGMYAQVTLEFDAQQNALTVPATSLLTEGAEAYVFAVHGPRAVRTPVKTGLDDGIRIEIRSGLVDGDRVIVAGKGLISDGDAVRPVAKDSPQ